MNAIALVTFFSMMLVSSPALCMRLAPLNMKPVVRKKPMVTTIHRTETTIEIQPENQPEIPTKPCCSVKKLRNRNLLIAFAALGGIKNYEDACRDLPMPADPSATVSQKILEADVSALITWLTGHPGLREKISNNTVTDPDVDLCLEWMKGFVGKCDHADDEKKAVAVATPAAAATTIPEIVAPVEDR